MKIRLFGRPALRALFVPKKTKILMIFAKIFGGKTVFFEYEFRPIFYEFEGDFRPRNLRKIGPRAYLWEKARHAFYIGFYSVECVSRLGREKDHR